MKLVIKGTAYPVKDAFSVPSLNKIREILSVTGLGPASIYERFAEYVTKPAREITENLEYLDGFRAFVWLARTAAGERVTLEEANDFDWSDWNWQLDEDEVTDEEVEPDPTPAQTDSDLGAEPKPRRRTATSKTSTKPSAPA